MSYLDIIITHYDEPWEVGKKLFDSLALQVCFDFNDVRIYLVQDGKDNELPWKELLSGYPYKVTVVTLKEHCGVGMARNAGLSKSCSDWVMFMDFDDILSDVATMNMLMNVFPITEDLHMVWSHYAKESCDFGRSDNHYINREREIDNRMIGKLYNRKFLTDNAIWFPTVFPEHSGFIFNSVVLAKSIGKHVMNFHTEFYPFFKTLRLNGAFSTFESLLKKVSSRFARDLYIAEQMQRLGEPIQRKMYRFLAIADTYHTIQEANEDPAKDRGITADVISTWKMYRDDIMSLSVYDREVLIDSSQTEVMTYLQMMYNHYGREYYLRNDDITIDRFIEILDEMASKAPEIKDKPQQTNTQEPVRNTEIISEDAGKRAVVYCGTKETYVNMIASVKSLLATTPVDKVFFLIEDDVFPYDIPDIIECRNVKNNHPFVEDGPNFNNVWTYMCLMRTVFPKLFPEYDRILSLDIDVVITEDISELWDIDLSDYYIAGVEENGHPDQLYVNFGIIMMNLAKLREDGMCDKLINAVNTENFGCPEQDAFNKYCNGHIYKLPNDYNVTVYSHITGEPMHEKILHYAGLRYWKHFSPVKKYFHIPWDELMKIQGELHG